tara:strand:+ start:4248 stop:4826 length:579 start_codon:yes stop_codon:yes gene_type:complete
MTPKSPLKWFAIAVGGTVAVAHIGILGHILNQDTGVAQTPTINIPRGPYSSYSIRAGKDGYEIEYRANDPTILESERTLDLDHERRGLFGGGREQRTETRRDQYTMDGVRNIGGEIGEVGKIASVSAECIAADAGARSQGAMAGTSIAAGVIVPAVSNIPYVGWLASGWALLLGQQAGSYVGGEVGSIFNDC